MSIDWYFKLRLFITVFIYLNLLKYNRKFIYRLGEKYISTIYLRERKEKSIISSLREEKDMRFGLSVPC